MCPNTHCRYLIPPGLVLHQSALQSQEVSNILASTTPRHSSKAGNTVPQHPFAQPPAKPGPWNQPHLLRSQSWMALFVNIEAIHLADLGQCMLEETESDSPFSLVPVHHDSLSCLCFALCTSLKIVQTSSLLITTSPRKHTAIYNSVAGKCLTEEQW